MSLFLFCVALLIAGYFIYGAFIERVFGIRPERQTPALTQADGVDFMTMPKWKLWLIQLLNIAGTGPIFGPILGALYGPVAMLWIVVGCIFAGAVHDYFCGMISIRNGGASIPHMAGRYLGQPAKHFINILALLLLVLVGAVFVTSPAGLLTQITEQVLGRTGEITQKGNPTHDGLVQIWVVIIFVYYIVATLLPIDKIIGRIYPLFGALLMFMTAGMMFGLLFEGIPLFRTVGLENGVSFSDFFKNFQPNPNLPIWPMIFLTISCGALSGFHATQTPMMARCAANEREGRFVFYGAMITEGVIALIWCMVGLSFYDDVQALQAAIKAGTPSKVVFDAAVSMLGTFGGILAVLGVVVLPITSGDTAFRAARLQIAEFFKFSQRSLQNRLMITVPLFLIGGWLTTVDFGVLWRYFNWANQTTATVMLWVAGAYLYTHRKLHWICTIPALLMTQVTIMFLSFNAQMGFGLSWTASFIIGALVSGTFLLLFLKLLKPVNPETTDD
ncbi:MAG: carbon starvation protein A [Cardiobacteriaceae bacterium]|nr:carbon starvation protein A [Cardiobacteriaceae bacterium]